MPKSEISVKQYVAGLRVPVNDAHPGVLVQVQEPLRDPFDDVPPFPPVQQRSSFLVYIATSYIKVGRTFTETPKLLLFLRK
jgi:hypothetical protein